MKNIVEKKLACQWLKHTVINYGMQQNFVPIVDKLTFSNMSNSDLHAVRVTITSEPEFAAAWTKMIDVIPAGQIVDIQAVPIEVNGTYLTSLTERLTGTLTLEVTCGEEELYRERSSLTALAYDQWAGLAMMPEMVAAFITPNHPAVATLGGEAAPYLKKWTSNTHSTRIRVATLTGFAIRLLQFMRLFKPRQ